MARLKKTVIKKGPSPEKIKLEEAAGFTELATSYIEALKSNEIQPEFIVKHSESFRRLFFDFLDGKIAYKEDVDGETKRLEEQAENQRELIKRLREEVNDLRADVEELKAWAKAAEEEEESGPEYGGTEPDFGPGESESSNSSEKGINGRVAKSFNG